MMQIQDFLWAVAVANDGKYVNYLLNRWVKCLTNADGSYKIHLWMLACLKADITPSRRCPRGICGQWVAGATALPASCEGVQNEDGAYASGLCLALLDFFLAFVPEALTGIE